ncbi:MAG: Thioredoxin family protein [Nevskia sp.]|nr:Thioredoxin family protein [Nevskia sp.]
MSVPNRRVEAVRSKNHRFPLRHALSSVLLLAALAGTSTHAAEDTLAAPLKAYAGKIVYVDFWASWCGPCAESFPWLNRMQTRYGNRMTIVAVDMDTDANAAKVFLDHHPAQFNVVYDPAGALAEHYHIDGMPSSVILDASGHVIHQHSGFHDARSGEYEAAIRKALDPSGSATGSTP